MAKELGIVEESTRRFNAQANYVDATDDVAEEVAGAKSAAAYDKSSSLYKDVYKEIGLKGGTIDIN